MRTMPSKTTAIAYITSIAFAVVLLLAWRSCVVDEWALEAATDSAGLNTRSAMKERRDYSVPGQFGDSFAPVSAFFTALAFIAAAASFHSQRKALQEQGDAAIAQAKTLERAIEHLGGQEDAIREQVTEQARANALVEKQVQLSERQASLLEHQLKLADRHINAIQSQVDQQKIANGHAKQHILALAEQATFTREQLELLGEQIRTQQLANHVNELAAQASVLRLSTDWDESGARAVRDHLAPQGSLPPELKKSPQEVWVRLVKANQAGQLETEEWHGRALSPEVMRILGNREVLEEVVRKTRAKTANKV
jgi:hypothetical protein